MSREVRIRPATAADAPALARHRVEMFQDMGELPPGSYDRLLEASRRYFVEAISAGRYWGWVAVDARRPEEIVGGVGLLMRERLPRATPQGGVEAAVEGYVINVFTERPWRRAGVARRLMEELIGWAKSQGVGRLALHASVEGRGLYQKLGFLTANEMRKNLT